MPTFFLKTDLFILDSASLEAIMQQINTNVASYGPHPTNTSDLRINQACLGKYAQDGFLYRVSIQQILNDQEVKVDADALILKSVTLILR